MGSCGGTSGSQVGRPPSLSSRLERSSLLPGLNMAGVDERQAFAKLEALKEIRHKTISLEKTRVALLCDVSQMEEEERCLNEYRYKLPGNCVKLPSAMIESYTHSHLRIATKSNVSMLSFCMACVITTFLLKLHWCKGNVNNLR